MTMDQSVTQESDRNSSDWLGSLIRGCADLPEPVRLADFTRVDERLLDDSLFQFLCAPNASGAEDPAVQKKIQRRIKALTPYRDRTLICVSIRLPGVAYTIEVDPAGECIVHWEWHAA